jgi:hypothetical protein
MKVLGRFVLMLIGVTSGVFLVLWLINDRRIPTLRVSQTLGQGTSVELDWIELK